MSKYNELNKKYKALLEKAAALDERVEYFEQQNAALSHELLIKEKYDKSVGAVIKALSVNIEKSLKSKNIINLNEDERNAMYYMIEAFRQLTTSAQS